ncbi:P27 family phage terminase small subunit [Streptomyces cyaneofuscatus]|uniref:P27 family phage terminase small subunit n=1 Tax=Streptomyces cyaneofuscatus TaxID=66883 RepID=UPI00295484C5|nr:P27 family phage terminase small subunit [Streptomyces cyaneofuscatus]WOP11816.1 P27 family phage terminase small subunit [Streptomyces cyaneofuscatus]
MAVRGAKPKPHLQAVREGTFREDRQSEGVKFAPVDPVEPDWELHLPGDGPDDELVRAEAAAAWARTVPMLVIAAGLSNTQRDTALEYCVTWARLVQAERHLSVEGLVVSTERGNVKNPWTTIIHQYRAHFRSLVGELGLSPAAATRLTPPESGGGDDDGVFD